MLTSIELTNYRGHASTKVPLSRFTLLVGDNAVGKTSVLEAVDLVSRLFVHGDALHKIFEGNSELRWLTRAGATSPEIAVEIDAPSGRLLVRPRLRGNSDLARSSVFAWSSVDGGVEERPLSNLWERTSLRHSSRRLSPAFARLALPSTSDEKVPTLAEDGFGLATFVAYLRLVDLDRYHKLIGGLRTVVPHVVDLEFGRVQLQKTVRRPINVNGQIILTDTTESFIADELRLKFADGAVLPAHSASEGTLIALAVLAVLHASEPPRVLLLDDLDRGLHPRAQGELVKALRAALETAPDTQVIATSHSPYLVDHFSAEEVVVLGRDEQSKEVVARRLSEHPDDRLRRAMTAGEFLNASGWYWP